MVKTMENEKKRDGVSGQKIDRKALKMRMQTLQGLLQNDEDGLRGFLMNRPALAEATGVKRLISQPDLSASNLELYVDDMREAFNGESCIPVSDLITSHSHLSRALRVRSKDESIDGLPMPIGAGRIGCCMTCAASPRAHLSARYATRRADGSNSEEIRDDDNSSVTGGEEYDSEYDANPWIDIGALTLMVPVLHWVKMKDVLRPRVSLVCQKCFDFAVTDTRNYMKRIETMSRLIPGKMVSPDPIPEAGRGKQRLPGRTPRQQNMDTLGKRKMLRLAQSVPQLKMLVSTRKKTTKHKGKPDEIVHIPVLSMDLSKATLIATSLAEREGKTLLEYYNAIINPREEAGEEE